MKRSRPADDGDDNDNNHNEDANNGNNENNEESSNNQNEEDDDDDEDLTDVLEGQDLEERRQIRKEQRELRHDIAASIDNPTEEKFDEFLHRNDELFQKVKYTLESAQDSINFALLAQMAKKTIENVDTEANFCPDFLGSLNRGFYDHNLGYFSWKKLGIACGNCILTIPSNNFLLGPLSKPPVEKVARQKRRQTSTKSNDPEVRPENLKADQQQNTQDVNTVRFNQLEKTFQKFKNKKEINMLEFLVNPNSFTQTVENFFDFSFMIKQGLAKIELKENQPIISPSQPDEASTRHQTIISLDLKSFKEISDTYKIKKPVIKPRQGSEYRKTILKSQMKSSQSDQKVDDESSNGS